MLCESKVRTMLKALASRHYGSCSSPNVNTICVLRLFVVLVITMRSFSAGAPTSPLLKNTCTCKFDLERTNTWGFAVSFHSVQDWSS